MIKEKVIVKFKVGLDARPASMFLRNSIKFKSDITLIKDEVRYNGKSILNILSMSAGSGEEIELEISGEDENLAMEKLKEFFEKSPEELYTI